MQDDEDVVDDPRLPDWAREATAERVRAGEDPKQAELHGYADAIAALKLVRRVEARRSAAQAVQAPPDPYAQPSGAAVSVAPARS